MSPRIRRLNLTAHVVASVGWLGALGAFLALVAHGLAAGDRETVRAVYLVAEPVVWLAIVPLAVASLLTGIVQSLSTPWGLFRHYWVVFKLALTLLATFVLWQYTSTLAHFAELAATAAAPDLSGLWSYLLHATAGLLVLIATTALGIYKPRGLTPYGQRSLRAERAPEA